MRCEIVMTVMMMVLMASGINGIFGRTTVGISRIPQYPKNRFIKPDALAHAGFLKTDSVQTAVCVSVFPYPKVINN